MKIGRPDDLDDLDDIAKRGLTVTDRKRVLADLRQEIVAVQARSHAVRGPDCRSSGACDVKDHLDHPVATLFGQVTVRLARFRCTGRGGLRGWHWMAVALPLGTGIGAEEAMGRAAGDSA